MVFTATIPPIANNPFIDKTTMPEGTLFIIFGAIFLGLALLVGAWRAYVVWSVRSAANSESKFTALEPSYGGPFIDPVVSPGFDEALEERRSSPPPSKRMSLPLRKKPETSRRDVQSLQPAQQRFFSPTVEVMTQGGALGNQPMVASSTYLPSGFYGRPGDRSSFAPSLLTTSTRPPSMLMSGTRPASVSMTMSDIGGSVAGGGTSTTGAATATTAPRRKLRPPSTYLDDLIGASNVDRSRS